MNNVKCNICYNSISETKKLTYFKCGNCIKKDDKLLCFDCIENNYKNCNNVCPFCKSHEDKEIIVDIIKLEEKSENIIIIKNKFNCIKVRKIVKSIVLFLTKFIKDIRNIKCRKINRIAPENNDFNYDYSFCCILLSCNIILKTLLAIIGWASISYIFFLIICGNNECYICTENYGKPLKNG